MRLFEEIRERVSAREVAEHYGFIVNRAGFTCCPFHDEKTASLKLFPGDRGWYCFGCHKGGSVIDFVKELYGLNAMEVAQKLNDDFRLGLTPDKLPTVAEKHEIQRQRDIRHAFEEWRQEMIRQLCAAFRVAHRLENTDLDKLTEAETLALQWRETMEDWLNCLQSEDMDAIMEIFRDRRCLERLLHRILTSTQTKSRAS